MEVLITGGSSLLGKYLVETSPDNVNIQATWHQNYVGNQWKAKRIYRMNLTDKPEVDMVFSNKKKKPTLNIYLTRV